MRITNDSSQFAQYMAWSRANAIMPSREGFDVWCNKKAASGATNTESGKEIRFSDSLAPKSEKVKGGVAL